MYCQMLRTVRDISRDDRARIATCSLRTPTDRQNYGIDAGPGAILSALLCNIEGGAVQCIIECDAASSDQLHRPS